MAEHFLFSFAQNLLSKLGYYALEQFGLAWGVTKELRKLEKSMSTIKGVLLDAEDQQTRNHTVREWLRRLKDIVHDMDDLVDEFATEALQRRVLTRGSTAREVHYFLMHSNPFKFRYSVGRKIKSIRERLDEVVADITKFDFAIKMCDRQIEVGEREETYSYVRSLDVIGRESDKEAVTRTLMSTSHVDNVCVVPIVGIGGLGKTTLAQLVYNDNRVASQFSKRLWVCVSESFHFERVMKKILKAAGASDCDHLGIEQLQSRLRQELSNEKYFLVLDDVWNEDRVEWIKVRDLLMVGAAGSRILTTTRSKTVASIMGTVPSYDLKGLSDSDCLSVLMKWAFNVGEYEKHQSLIDIGIEIVKKCRGVPLAARTLGGLLYSKNDESDWLSVRDNEIWSFVQKENGILPILRLSYDRMPTCVKQCFAYCSLFKKDQEIDKWKLIYLWMAQGFIESSQNEEQEDTGEGYFNELVKRSFLQQEENECFKMHDLIHDLAQSVAGDECFAIRSKVVSVPEGVRHVSFSQLAPFPEPLLEVKRLRTIFSHKIGTSNGFTLISTFRYLRVLDLNNFVEVQSSIGDLKHLRYLSIVENCSTLPESVGRLLNLQYLKLHCSYLRELPKDFGNLINLRYLSLSSRSMKCLPESGIGGLTSLRTLSISRSLKLTSLSEGIQHLTHLRKLEINECPKLALLPSGMRYLTALERLRIESCDALRFADDDLQGLRSLKFLTILNLPGLMKLPKGLCDSAGTLKHMEIWYCKNLTMLQESFSNFASVRKLEIVSCPSLLSLPEGMQHIRYFYVEFCCHLSTRCKREVGEDWSKISHVPELYVDKERIITAKS
ncbi:hypothetical protein RJ640_023642 [Escallonia rubra]|uniref:Disease resistance protein RGA3 n=1 Tax=Escallonia rubra TaxID=112253 RepID=A0AA88RWX2_9ASTE|nr:hypothetical protein RJ640_023642 [Escallonia rubra]